MKFLVALMVLSGSVANVDCDEDDFVIYRIIDKVPVVLQDEYGVMLINDCSIEIPVPRYILAIRSVRTLIDSRNIDEFKKGLSAVPAEEVVHEYISCSVSRSFGLQQEHIDEFHSLFEEFRLELSDQPRITCYCDAAVK